jgi:DNA-binding MarR family transcriptional regulator
VWNNNPVEKIGRRDVPSEPRTNAAFLLAQIGSHAAARFAERLLAVGLAPPHAGILRMLGGESGITQQALASRLQIVPSRLVALLDTLDSRGLVERRRNQDDRRSHALHLTADGRKMLGTLGEISREHQRDLLASLSDDERRQLHELLQRVADEQGLTRHVHPGYSSLGSGKVQNGPQ